MIPPLITPSSPDMSIKRRTLRPSRSTGGRSRRRASRARSCSRLGRAIARVIGETAPLLVTVGITAATQNNPFVNERMAALPVYAYYQLTQPGVPPQFGIDRAWTAALVLIILVMALNLVARLISRFFAPKTGR